MTHRIIVSDVLDGLAQLGDGSVQCCVTSPPYWTSTVLGAMMCPCRISEDVLRKGNTGVNPRSFGSGNGLSKNTSTGIARPLISLLSLGSAIRPCCIGLRNMASRRERCRKFGRLNTGERQGKETRCMGSVAFSTQTGKAGTPPIAKRYTADWNGRGLYRQFVNATAHADCVMAHTGLRYTTLSRFLKHLYLLWTSATRYYCAMIAM
jgi:hypothetical protein